MPSFSLAITPSLAHILRQILKQIQHHVLGNMDAIGCPVIIASTLGLVHNLEPRPRINGLFISQTLFYIIVATDLIMVEKGIQTYFLYYG